MRVYERSDYSYAIIGAFPAVHFRHSWQDHLEMANMLAADRGFKERTIFLSTEDASVVHEALNTKGWQVLVLPWARANEAFETAVAEGASAMYPV
jgi:hypothetical protein